MSSIFQEPGLHTDTPNPRDPIHLRHCGFKWIVQQTQNGDNPVKPLNLVAYKNVGFKIGPWGVHYKGGNTESDCTKLLSSARNPTLSDILVLNVEYVMSRAIALDITQRLKSFTGWKALICLVGDLVAMKNTGAIQVFIDAGWSIIGETYTNDQEHLTPAEAEWQALNAGIPRDRFSHALGMYFGKRNLFVTGAEYAALLRQANAGRRFSLWMVEHGAESNFLELRAQALPPAPPPEPEPAISQFAQLREHAVGDLVAALDLVEDARQRGSAPRPYWAHKVLTSTPEELKKLVDALDDIWPV